MPSKLVGRYPLGMDTALAMFAEIATVPAPDLADPAVAEFSEQFSLDVSSMDDGQRRAFFAATGERAFVVTQQIYVHDMAARFRAVLQVVDGLDLPPASTSTSTAELWPRLESFMAAVARLDSLDPTLTEMVRLRGARLHSCAVCTSRRSIDALDAGATERDFRAIDNWSQSNLPDRTKAALGLVDAMLFAPRDLPQSVVVEALLHLSKEEIVEVLLDVVRNGANKIAVALGADTADVIEGVELFTTDADGNVNVVKALTS